MSKLYKCDSCEVIIEKPHQVKMKEFYISTVYDFCGSSSSNKTRRVKIHLCEDCFNGLRHISSNLRKK